jgi:transcriptional regulator with XRE-family HTH domain
LLELRDAAGLTPSQLAERAVLHRQGVAKLELGEREPTRATVRTLAKALGVNCLAFDFDDAMPEEEPARPPGRPCKADTAGEEGEEEVTIKGLTFTHIMRI